MKNLIKTVCVVIGIACLLSFAGCGKKSNDTKPENNQENQVNIGSKDNDNTAISSEITGISAVGKLTTPHGDYYLAETFGEFLGQFASDEYEIKISDKEGNKYTLDDLDSTIDSKFVSATVKCDGKSVCNITTQRVSGLKIGEIKIEQFKTEEMTTSLELNGFVIEFGKTTIEDIVSGIGDYAKRTTTDETLNSYPFIFEGCELGQCDVNCNDDNSVKYITVTVIDTFHKG